ncbi:hypothetical protein QBC35DRAFT_455267 [Podospora australis]|uniref:Uncharacterized protein n=1 Tax=Podospora australis TaxID=1536484 RepID=A0AAN7AEN4_9PEZI|nr:hypothetical protein QBC35DRAFT_455267 [Podospora australis]
MQRAIKTTFLLLSDTHAKNGLVVPDLPVDVAIHCDDLTGGSTIHEFVTTLALLRSIYNGASSVIETLATIKPCHSDSIEMKLEKESRLRSLTERGISKNKSLRPRRVSG